MQYYRNSCEACGGTLKKVDDSHYVCEYCDTVFSVEKVENYVEKLTKLLDEAKLEMISNARKNLYNAVTAKYISSEEIHECCIEIKKYLPDDFQANFYDGVVSKTRQEVAQMIRKIDVEKDFDYLETIIKFLICSLESEFVIGTKSLIERAYYNSDKEKYYKYTTMVEDEAEKLDNFIYSTTYPRKAFIAYSSKDAEKAMQLVETLEAQGISCFISIRNLRHGAGSRENYDKSLKEAMDNCTSFVFVSSMNSRNASCDALRIEIPYIKQKDIENAPGHLKNYYSRIPNEYKKPRVEYRIQESMNENFADELVDEFFDGYERVYIANDVAKRVMRQSIGFDVNFSASQNNTINNVKFCVSCLSENKINAKKCTECGGVKFANDLNEVAQIRKKEREEKIKREEERARKEQERLKRQKELEKLEEERRKEEAERRRIDEENFKKSAERRRIDEEKLKKEIERRRILQEERKRKEEEERKRKQEEERKRKQEEDAKRESSAGLEFELNDKGYTLTKVGSCTEEHIVIDMHKGLPVTSIDYNAFYKCEKLTSITIPNSVTSIGSWAFSYCSKLTNILVDENNTKYKSINGNVYTKDEKTLVCYAVGKTDKTFTIPNSVTSIGNYAFYSCKNLTSITIPNSVTSIGEEAFNWCSNLTSITMPNSLMSIGKGAFYNCHIEKATLNSFALSWIPKEYLSCVTIFDGAKSIGDSAFLGYSNLTSITIPNSVTKIGKNAFLGCKNLTSITIPNSVTSIGDSAFGGCSNLTSITIPNGVTSIGNYAFRDCTKLTSITIPNSVTSIGKNAFLGCKNLTSITIPNSVTSIGNCAFSCCTKLTSITIPNSVTSIGDSAFSSCSNLTSITIPNSVTSIGNYAFRDCTKLTSITIPNSVTSIGNCAFRDCSNLTSITIPNSVTSIDYSAFWGCSDLRSITIPNSITSIGKEAFFMCENLKHIYCFKNFNKIKGIRRAKISSGTVKFYYSESKPILKLFKRYWHYVNGVPTEW